MSVLVKAGMTYTVVGKSGSNCGICRVAFAADVATCPLDVPTLIVAEIVSSGPCGAFVQCKCVLLLNPQFLCVVVGGYFSFLQISWVHKFGWDYRLN